MAFGQQPQHLGVIIEIDAGELSRFRSAVFSTTIENLFNPSDEDLGAAAAASVAQS